MTDSSTQATAFDVEFAIMGTSPLAVLEASYLSVVVTP